MKQRNAMLNRKSALGDLGIYDGPPIGPCPVADRLRANAIAGSQRLASTIKFLGPRP